jgi:GntR family transcriptional repressor for pyruvate dehydrogenase complex
MIYWTNHLPLLTDHLPLLSLTDRIDEISSGRPPAAPFEVVPIDRVDVFQTVLQRLQDWIQDSDLQPGDRMPPERELAERLQVSRTSVRQALKVLTSLNRVEQRHGSGTYLRSPARDPIASMLLGELSTTEAELLSDVSALRAAVDALAVELAADRAQPEDIERLRTFLDEREHELGEEPASPGSLDLVFEVRIAEIAHNELLSRVQGMVHEIFLQSWAGQGLAPADVMSLHEEHLLIVRAMEEGDWSKAASTMRNHVSRRANVADSE